MTHNGGKATKQLAPQRNSGILQPIWSANNFNTTVHILPPAILINCDSHFPIFCDNAVHEQNFHPITSQPKLSNSWMQKKKKMQPTNVLKPHSLLQWKQPLLTISYFICMTFMELSIPSPNRHLSISFSVSTWCRIKHSPPEAAITGIV